MNKTIDYVLNEGNNESIVIEKTDANAVKESEKELLTSISKLSNSEKS